MDLPDLPLPPGPWPYGERFLEALRVAALLHAAQVRKSTAAPYVAHVLGVCAIALEHGADEDEAIAALLHDVIEDVEPIDRAREVVAAFGPRVLTLVEGATDSMARPSPPWRERKEAYLARLAEADASALLVSGADKLYNSRAIVADLRRMGPAAWDRFNAPRHDVLWYYRACVTVYRANPAHRAELVDDVDRLVRDMEYLAGTG